MKIAFINTQNKTEKYASLMLSYYFHSTVMKPFCSEVQGKSMHLFRHHETFLVLV